MWRIRDLSWRAVTPHWRLSIAEDGEEAIFYLIIIAVVVAAIVAFIGAVLSVGVFVLGAVALAGGVWGLFMAIYNFFAVLIEAHKKVK